MHRRFPLALLTAAAVLMSAADLALSATTPASASPTVAVGPQYDTTHVYIAPADIDRFVASFIATFGGQSTKQVVSTVTGRSHSDLAEERNAATFGASMGVASLPQLLRMKLMISAASWSVRRHANAGIANCAGVTDVLEVFEPNSTIETSDSGLSDSTTGFPARLGNTPS